MNPEFEAPDPLQKITTPPVRTSTLVVGGDEDLASSLQSCGVDDGAVQIMNKLPPTSSPPCQWHKGGSSGRCSSGPLDLIMSLCYVGGF